MTLTALTTKKVKCQSCGKYFEYESVDRMLNSKSLRVYYKLPQNIKICSNDCFVDITRKRTIELVIQKINEKQYS